MSAQTPSEKRTIFINELDDHVASITVKTLDILFSKFEYQDAIILYFFYIKTAKMQRTAQVWAGSHYIMKILHWGNKRFCDAKKTLKDLNLVEDITNKDSKGVIQKFYVRVKFIWNPVMLESSDAETQSLATGTQIQDELLDYRLNHRLDYNKTEIIKLQDEREGKPLGGKPHGEQASKIDSMDLFLEAFNSKFASHYHPTVGRRVKLNMRLKTFTIDQILVAITNLAASPWHRGENDRGWVADPDFLLRADEQIDKWYQKAPPIEERLDFYPLTDLEVWELAGELDIPVLTVNNKMQEVLRLATTGEIKK
jgi:hypothetical protein